MSPAGSVRTPCCRREENALTHAKINNYLFFGSQLTQSRLSAAGPSSSRFILSGDGDILDELRFARGRVDDDRLIAAVGSVAARRFGIPEPSLMPGARADLVVLHRPLLEASFADVALVVAAGRLRVLDPVLLPQLPVTHGSIVTWAW